MWSFAIILWELYTKEIPFEEYLPIQCGILVKKFYKNSRFKKKTSINIFFKDYKRIIKSSIANRHVKSHKKTDTHLYERGSCQKA